MDDTDAQSLLISRHPYFEKQAQPQGEKNPDTGRLELETSPSLSFLHTVLAHGRSTRIAAFHAPLFFFPSSSILLTWTSAGGGHSRSCVG